MHCWCCGRHDGWGIPRVPLCAHAALRVAATSVADDPHKRRHTIGIFMSLTKYAKRLIAAVSAEDGAALEKLCMDLEYDQLGKENWPQEAFDFFIEALCNPQNCIVKGSMGFITSLYNDFDKLTQEQHATLLKVLDDNADEFGDEMLRHAASDMIARLYPVPVALKKFNEWMRLGTPRRLHMAQAGFEVLVMAKRLEPSEEAKVRDHLQKLWKRKD